MDSLMEDCVLRRNEAGVAVVSLCAPQMRNSITVPMREQLLELLQNAVVDPAVRAIVLTGEGGNFCSGGRLSPGESTQPDADRTRRNISVLHEIVRTIVNAGKPVIAAAEGFSYGAGLSFVAACDYVIAGESARFCAVFPKIGLIPDAGLGWSLVQRVGMAEARDLLLTARDIRAPEARELGLVNKVAADGCALAAALEYAEQFVRVAPLAVAAIKQMLSENAHSLESVFAAELEMQPRLTFSEDYVEGRAAFKERRAPVFQGS